MSTVGVIGSGPGSSAPAGAEDTVAAARAAGTRTRVPGWLVVLWANSKCRVGLVMLAVFVLDAVFAPLIAPFDPRSTAFSPALGPDRTHLLGTTTLGQDIFSQVIWGARTSLIVGLLCGLIATAIAFVIGMLAGYAGGWVDEVLSFVINLGLVVPVLPLMITIAAYAPVHGIELTVIVISITSWAYAARLKRSQIVTLRTRDYITAARFAGDSTWRIIFREIAPNMVSLIVVGFMSAATGAVGAEAGLEFLGLGDPNTVSWGTMLYSANTNGALLTGQWTWIIIPGLLLALLITSFSFINFGVDALSNPRLRED